MSRVCIVGWDGATFDLIQPWARQGKLPAIARLLESGAHGPLRSTVPPMTFPAWSSFMTGTNPGKHGIYDFTRQRPGTYELEFVNGGQRRAPTFWRLLSDAGRKVISVSVPCTFPPEPVNGIMISGFDAPGLGGKGAYVDGRGMYPPELFDELEKTVGRHPIGAFIIDDINSGRPEVGLERVLESIRAKAATAKYLMAQHPWDCFMILFGESDGVGHHYWKYADPDSPLFQEHPAGLRDSILRVYQELDRQLGELLERLPPDAQLLMMSDHGFGGSTNWVLYPNCWLRERGFLGFRGGVSRWFSRTLDAMKMRAVANLPARFKRGLYRFSRRGLGNIEARVRYGMIDWSTTQAYFEENPYWPVLWVNLKGRQPKGIVEPGQEYEDLRDRLIADLEAWRHPETGEPVVEKAFRREEVYEGPCTEEAPDIIVKWGLHRGYSYTFKVSSRSPRLAWCEQVDPNRPVNLAFFLGKSGHHRDDGIFVAWGPGIRSGTTLTGARIVDLAPTILHAQGVPIPGDMDGRALTEIFAEPVLAAPVAVASASAEGNANGEGAHYSSDDEELIADRLRSLGYLD